MYIVVEDLEQRPIDSPFGMGGQVVKVVEVREDRPLWNWISFDRDGYEVYKRCDFSDVEVEEGDVLNRSTSLQRHFRPSYSKTYELKENVSGFFEFVRFVLMIRML